MRRALIIGSVVVLAVAAGAPSFAVHAARELSDTPSSNADSVYTKTSAPGNSYTIGPSVVLTTGVTGDFSALGGSIITATTVAGDNLLIGGSVRSRGSVGGDLRSIGGEISIDAPVKGDLVAAGYRVDARDRVGGSVLIAAINTSLAGAAGPVTVYGNNIALSGVYDSDVTVVASGRVTLAASTTINGALHYESPERATIPASVVVRGGVTYTNASYLPNIGTSRVLALINLGFFLLARILGALILAGLLAGLFPRFAQALTERAYQSRRRHLLLTTLLGFAIFVATPILIVILLLSFIGIGLALLLFILYALLVMLSLLYSGIMLGSVFARRYVHRTTVLWRDGVVGTLILSIVVLAPFVGPVVVGLLAAYCAGALLQMFFERAFPSETDTPELL